MLLDLLPHLLDGTVERLVRLLLARDKVVCVVSGLVGWAPGLSEGRVGGGSC